jgi:hypothetical protein
MSDILTLKEALSDMAESEEFTVTLGRRASELTADFLAKASADEAATLKEWLIARINLGTVTGKARAKLSYLNRRTYILQCALDRAEGKPPPAEPD